MMNYMKDFKYMKYIVFCLVPLFFSGCTHDMNRREIDEINFIRVMGIDYSDGEYTISALYSSGGADPEEGAGGAEEEVTEGKGKSPYQAFEDIRLKNKKTISVANIGYFLIGTEASTNGIDICLDFLSRDQTIKMDSLIYVLKDSKASDFINKAIEEEQKVNEDLEAVEQKQAQLITRNDNTLVNILNEMEQTHSSVLVPYLISEEKSFLIEGYAVFKDHKLKDFLDIETSSGINFVKDIIRAYPIYLENQVGLELSYSSTNLKTELENNNIKVIIRVDFETMVREVNRKEEVFTRDGLMDLTKKQNEYIRQVIQKAVDYSVNNGLDIMQIARLVENQHVKRWKDLEEDWDDLISDIEYEIVANSKISKSFILGDKK